MPAHLSVNSRRPTHDFEASVNALYEFEAGETELTGTVSGPLGESVSGRLAVKWRKMEDGWIKNTFLEKDEPAQEDTMARLSFVWDVTDALEVYVKGEYADLTWDGRATQQFNCLPTALTWATV